MFDKIPSLKDFILYVIPGIIYCYITLDLYNYLESGNYIYDKVISNANLSFIGIIFSFIIGFLLSQAQIILFGKLFDKKLKKIRTIAQTQKSNTEIKKTLIKRLKNVFELQTVSETDDLLVFLCLNYVKVKTNENSNTYIDRMYNMSTFAMTAYLPVLLVLTDLLIKLKLSFCCILFIISMMSFTLYLLVKKIVINFREDYYKNVFRQFIVLSE